MGITTRAALSRPAPPVGDPVCTVLAVEGVVAVAVVVADDCCHWHWPSARAGVVALAALAGETKVVREAFDTRRGLALLCIPLCAPVLALESLSCSLSQLVDIPCQA